MPCYHPLKAMRSSSGVTILNSDAEIFNLKLACGQCVGCRLERSKQWAIRCMHEASLYENNSFISLTYDDANVPHDGSLNHKHFQLFMKRLRARFPDNNIRYYMCGEYGGERGRPHYHAILFNHTFTDLSIWKVSDLGHSLFRSAVLESLWPFGFSSIGSVTFESAAYVARYIMKKQTGSLSSRYYQAVSTVTGEVFDRRPEYNSMSLKPGIGYDWFSKYHSDVFPRDACIVDGTPSHPPRYYDKLLKRLNPDLLVKIKSNRVLDINDNWVDNTPHRLIAKEIVTKSILSNLTRSLK
ncbi:MAG: replication initiator protein [Microvirus sp.]|nr:MAG: replication initiator protein [Microvirus sp.]